MSHMQRTPSTRKNCLAHINWMNGKKSKAVLFGSTVKMFCKKCVLKNFAKLTGKCLRPAT